jgi:hypothetical protein
MQQLKFLISLENRRADKKLIVGQLDDDRELTNCSYCSKFARYYLLVDSGARHDEIFLCNNCSDFLIRGLQ